MVSNQSRNVVGTDGTVVTNPDGTPLTQEFERTDCDHTSVILRDHISLYPGYVEIKDGQVFAHYSDDPDNEISGPSDPRWSEFMARAKGVKNKQAFERVVDLGPAPVGAPTTGHFISFDGMLSWIHKKAHQLMDTPPVEEPTIPETPPETDAPADTPTPPATETPAEPPTPETPLSEEIPEDVPTTGELPLVTEPLPEGTEPPVVDLTDEPKPSGELPSEPGADPSPTLPDESPAETPGPEETPEPEPATSIPEEGETAAETLEAAGAIPTVEEVPDRCPTCGFGSSDPTALIRHLSSHLTEETASPSVAEDLGVADTPTADVSVEETAPVAPPTEVFCPVCETGGSETEHDCPRKAAATPTA